MFALRLLVLAALLASSAAVAADRPAASQIAVDSHAPAASMSAIPAANSTDPRPGYYRPSCDPHSDSYAAHSCHSSCAAWWCGLYWDQHP